MLSARNQLKGKVKSVKLGSIMAEISIAIGDNDLVSVITRSSVERLNIKVGDEVTVVIKATEVMLSTD